MNTLNLNYYPDSGGNNANEFYQESIPKIKTNSNEELVLLCLENSIGQSKV